MLDSYSESLKRFMQQSPVNVTTPDVRLFRLYEGTSQIHQLNIVKQMRRQIVGVPDVR